MFKAEIRADTLKGLVNVISTLIDEVKFTISPEGKEILAEPLTASERFERLFP